MIMKITAHWISGYIRYVDESDTEFESDNIPKSEDRYVEEVKFQLKDPLLEDISFKSRRRHLTKKESYLKKGGTPWARPNTSLKTGAMDMTQLYTQKGRKTSTPFPKMASSEFVLSVHRWSQSVSPGQNLAFNPKRKSRSGPPGLQ